MKKHLPFFYAFIIGCLSALSCQKDDLITGPGADLDFSTDTIYFDTVLSTLGSVTGSFTIYNPHDLAINISDLYLANGESSFYQLNVDGSPGKEFHDLRVEAGDSIFVFVSVTVDPLNENNPVILKDSVIFNTNGNQQNVKLISYGQDVKVIYRKSLETTTWTNEKPYLIVDYAIIDSNTVLTIEEGTRVYLTNDSRIEVQGRIIANGTAEAPILFTGSRFDGQYENVSGQWGSIFFLQKSTGNRLNHVIIKNAKQGMLVGYPDEDTRTEIELRNCMILNTATIGIYSFNATINAYNTVIADCGYFAILVQMGGNYNFYHCTVSNVSAYYGDSKYSARPNARTSLLYANYTDWYELDENYWVQDRTFSRDLDLNFYNSIIYGINKNEIRYDTIQDAGLKYSFNHCLLKIAKDSLVKFDTNNFVSIIKNHDPEFINDSISLANYDFRLDSASPAINTGDPDIINLIPVLEFDFNGNARMLDGLPDIGAYERVE